MGKDREYTAHQRRIIDNYYKTAKERSLKTLQEIVTELYLAGTEKKRMQLWQRARKALEGLEMKPSLIEHIIATGKPEVLAEHVKDLF